MIEDKTISYWEHETADSNDSTWFVIALLILRIFMLLTYGIGCCLLSICVMKISLYIIKVLLCYL